MNFKIMLYGALLILVSMASFAFAFDNRVNVTDITRNEDTYLYKDFGADYFDNFSINFSSKIIVGSSGIGGVMALTNSVDDLYNVAEGVDVIVHESGGVYDIYLNRAPGTTAYDTYTASVNTTYYFTLYRTAGNDTIQLKIYSDSARTNLLDTLSVSGFGTTKYEYLFAVDSWDSGDSTYTISYSTGDIRAISSIEDLDTYTKTDPNNRLTLYQTIFPLSVDIKTPSNTTYVSSDVYAEFIANSTSDATITAKIYLDEVLKDTLSVSNATLTNSSDYALGEGSHNLTIVVNDSSNTANDSVFFTTEYYNFTGFSPSYARELDNATIKANLTAGFLVNVTSANLTYNGTSYMASYSYTNDTCSQHCLEAHRYYTLQKTLAIPFVSSNATNVSYYFSVAASPEPVLYYKFDSSTTPVQDYSPFGNTGTVTGATWTSSGKYGGAYNFDGDNDYITLLNPIYAQQNATYDVWVKRANDTSGDAVMGNSSAVGYVFYFASSNTALYTGAGVGSQQVYWTITPSDFIDKWAHLVLTKKNTTMELFINGVSQGTKTLNGVTSIVDIGRGQGAVFNGTIDEVKIYNRLYDESMAANSTPQNLTVYLSYWFAPLSDVNATEQSNVTFTTFIGNSSSLASIGGTVVVNSTSAPASLVASNSTTQTYNTSFVFGAISGDNQSFVINRTFTLTYGSYSKTLTDTSTNLTLFKIYAYNCSGAAGEAVALNITTYKSIDNSLLNDLRQDINIYLTTNTGNSRNYSWQRSNINNTLICITPTWATYQGDGWVEASKSGYATRRFWLVNATLTNSTQEFRTYLLNSSLATFTTANVQDQYGLGVSDVLIKYMRYYPNENAYFTTAEIMTDADGNGGTYLQHNDVFYKTLLEQDNSVLKSYLSTQITSNALSYYIDSAYSSIWDNLSDVNYECHNTTGQMWVCTVSNTEGVSTLAELDVYKQQPFNATTICSTQATGSAVTLMCNYSALNGTEGYWRLWLVGSYHPLDSGIFTGTSVSAFGLEGLAAAGLIVISLVATFAGAPVIALLMVVVGVIASMLMGILTFTSAAGAIIGLIIAVIAIMYTVKEKR